MKCHSYCWKFPCKKHTNHKASPPATRRRVICGVLNKGHSRACYGAFVIISPFSSFPALSSHLPIHTQILPWGTKLPDRSFSPLPPPPHIPPSAWNASSHPSGAHSHLSCRAPKKPLLNEFHAPAGFGPTPILALIAPHQNSPFHFFYLLH